MRRQLIHVLVGVFTFVIGITAASITYHVARNWTVGEPALRTSPLVVNKQIRTYQRFAAGIDTTGSFTMFNSSDGMNFTKWTAEYASPKDAERKLQTRIKTATEIIRRESVIDNDGRKIGEKIVALFPGKDPDSRVASLLWTEKERLYEVESSSCRIFWSIGKISNADSKVPPI